MRLDAGEKGALSVKGTLSLQHGLGSSSNEKCNLDAVLIHDAKLRCRSMMCSAGVELHAGPTSVMLYRWSKTITLYLTV